MVNRIISLILVNPTHEFAVSDRKLNSVCSSSNTYLDVVVVRMSLAKGQLNDLQKEAEEKRAVERKLAEEKRASELQLAAEIQEKEAAEEKVRIEAVLQEEVRMRRQAEEGTGSADEEQESIKEICETITTKPPESEANPSCLVFYYFCDQPCTR